MKPKKTSIVNYPLSKILRKEEKTHLIFHGLHSMILYVKALQTITTRNRHPSKLKVTQCKNRGFTLVISHKTYIKTF